jgi:TonB family protein
LDFAQAEDPAKPGSTVPKRAFQTSADATGSRNPVDGTVAEAASAVQLIALASDAGLLDLLRGALEGRQRAWRADDASQAAELLLAAPSSVIFIDVAVTQQDTGSLVERLNAQFPGLQVIVSGRRDDEAALSSLISSGAIFRFLHKPASAERVRNFVSAAIRRCAEQPPQPPQPLRPATPAATAPAEPEPEPALPTVAPTVPNSRAGRRVAAGLLLVALLVAATIVLPRFLPWLQDAGPAPRTAVTPAETIIPASDPALQQRLDQAALAQDTGRLAEPFGENAIELYHAALRIDPGNELAAQGLSEIAAALLAQAEAALQNGDLGAAASALDSARSATPTDPRVALLSGELARARELMTRGRVRPPADSRPAAAPRAAATSQSQPSRPTRAPTAAVPPPARSTAEEQALADGDRQGDSERGRGVATIASGPTSGVAAASSAGASTAGHAPAVSRVLPESALVRTRHVTAAYPVRAAAQGIEGWVELEFTVSADGRTRDVLVTDSNPPRVFDRAAAAAVARWRYQPQVVDGQAVDQRVAARLRFSLDDR